jgi:hypothetical protein
MTASGAHLARRGHLLVRSLLVFAFVLLLGVPCHAQMTDSVCTLTVTRTGVVFGYTGPTPTQSFIVTVPPPVISTTVIPPRAVLILLPGGDGNINLTPIPPTLSSSTTCPPGLTDGTLHINSNNFLVRSRWLFAGRNYIVVTLDSATDFQFVTPPGLTGNQGNPLHIADVVQVIAWARATYPGLKVWLVGTSRGTAGAWVASMNAPPIGPDGLVFTSPVNSGVVPPATTPDPDSLQNPTANVAAITIPTMILSNDSDACAVSAPSNDATVAALFTSTKVKVVNITGGVGFNPLSTDPCDALTFHGFFARERLAVLATTDFIK